MATKAKKLTKVQLAWWDAIQNFATHHASTKRYSVGRIDRAEDGSFILFTQRDDTIKALVEAGLIERLRGRYVRIVTDAGTAQPATPDAAAVESETVAKWSAEIRAEKFRIGDFVIIKPDARVASPNIRQYRDFGAIGRVLPDINSDDPAAFYVVFPDRFYVAGENALHFRQDDQCIELVNIAELSSKVVPFTDAVSFTVDALPADRALSQNAAGEG